MDRHESSSNETRNKFYRQLRTYRRFVSKAPGSRPSVPLTFVQDRATPAMTPLTPVLSLKISSASAIFPVCLSANNRLGSVHGAVTFGLSRHGFPPGNFWGGRPAPHPAGLRRCYSAAVPPLRNCTDGAYLPGYRSRPARSGHQEALAAGGGATGRAVPARYGRFARWPGVPPRCPFPDGPPRHGS